MTASIDVTPVSTRAEKRQFLNLPWTIYRDDPHWIPPLRMNQKAVVGYAKHPFYEFAKAQTFLARRDGQISGRISAIVNPNHNQRHDDQCGFFGFFESVNDSAVSAALLGAAADWLAPHGLSTMRGPVNPSMNYECGLLVDGFDSPPTFMLTYNPPYYSTLLEEFGFRKAQDMYSYAQDRSFLSQIDPKLYSIVEAVKERFRVRVRKFDMSNYKRDVGTLLELFNRGTVGSWGFVPLTDGEAEHMGKDLRHLLVPEFIRLAEADGEPVGALMGLLDYNPLIKRINGRLLPFGFLHILLRRKQLKRVRFVSANVLPEYQRWGLGLVLLDANQREGLDWGIEEAEFSWVLESNQLSRLTLEKGGLKPVKTFRLYDVAIGADDTSEATT
jgi:GNAT superfamily N-acetyltransferase